MHTINTDLLPEVLKSMTLSIPKTDEESWEKKLAAIHPDQIKARIESLKDMDPAFEGSLLYPDVIAATDNIKAQLNLMAEYCATKVGQPWTYHDQEQLGAVLFYLTNVWQSIGSLFFKLSANKWNPTSIYNDLEKILSDCNNPSKFIDEYLG